MSARTRIGAGIIAVGLALACRIWLMSGTEPVDDDTPIQPVLSADFDPYLHARDLIRPLHEPKRPNQPGDWLERFPEHGQTFPEYAQARGRKPLSADFAGIDLKPLGEFTATQQRIIQQTAEFMGHFFGTPVNSLDAEPLPDIPDASRRMRNDTEQILSTWLLHEVLKPQRRPDAIATIGLVTSDLWPGNLNWVFGQASITDRIGVWSLHRNGDPDLNENEYRLCLRRTLKTAVHETGHMLGMPHCVSHECCMNGSRSREESDRQPLEFCPECQAKIWWTCNTDPVHRCKSLFEFCEREGLVTEAGQFQREWETLRQNVNQ